MRDVITMATRGAKPVWLVGLLALFVGFAGCVESNNRAPEIAPIEDVVFEAGIPNFIEISAEDPDGDPISFSLRLDPTPPSVLARPDTAPQIDAVTHGAILTWLPSQEDGETEPGTVYVATLIADDGRGGTAGRALRITVVTSAAPSVAALRFEEPTVPGVFAEAPCIESVVVRAGGTNDDNGIVLGVESEPLAGYCADTARVDCPVIAPDEVVPGQGLLEWCPSDELMAEGVHHDLWLSAETPGTDMLASQAFFVRFDWPAGPGCPEERAGIDHESPPGGFAVNSTLIEASFTNVADLKTLPILAYQVRSRGAQEAYTQWRAVPFSMDNPQSWSAAPIILDDDSSGGPRELVYRIVVTTSNGAGDGTCHTTTKSDIYVVPIMESLGDEVAGGQCDECISDADCAGQGSLCVPIHTGAFCMTSCAGVGDCVDGAACARVQSLDGRVGNQCVPSNQDCGQRCMRDALEGNYGNDLREDAYRLENGEHQDLTVCGGEHDWYRVPVTAGQSLRVEVAFDANQGDLDLNVMQPGNLEDPEASETGQRNREHVYIPCIETDGQAFIHVWGYAQAENEYSLTVETGVGCQEIECALDEYEDLEQNDRWRGVQIEPPWEPSDLTLCPGDVDRYFFRTERPMRVGVQFASEASAGTIELKAFRGENLIQDAQMAGRGSRMLSWNSARGATYVLEIMGSSAHATGTYSLHVQTDPTPSAGAPCVGDACIDMPCTTDDECGQGALCAPTIGLEVRGTDTGRCARRCANTGDCDIHNACKNLGMDKRVCLASGRQDTGQGCSGHVECEGGRACLDGPGGYCALVGCEEGDCPDNAICVLWDETPVCHQRCEGDRDCRGARGYECTRSRDVPGPYCGHRD